MLQQHRAACSQLEAARQRHIRESFQCFDEDSKGWLTRSELKCAIASLIGVRPSKAEVERVMQSGANEGQLEFAAFATAMEARLGAVHPEEHMRDLFRTFDVQCQGFITRQDLHHVFAECMSSVPSAVVDEIFDEVDTDMDGRVSCREFCAIMRESVTLQ